MIAVLNMLPFWVQSLVKHHWPGLFLPARVVLKLLKPGWGDEFDNEKLMYNKLRDLQGIHIPTFFGEAEYAGQRALLISYVNGDTLDNITHLEAADLERKLKDAFASLQPYGVAQEDHNLNNYILVDDQRIVIIDLERVLEPLSADHFQEPGRPHEPASPEEVAESAESTIWMIVRSYKLQKEAAECGDSW